MFFRKRDRKQNTSTAESVEEAKQETPSSGADLSSLTVSLEKLKAESEAGKELRKANNERFSRISEQIGELRALFRESEKAQIQTDTKTEKAVGLVEAVQPQKLMSDVQKTDFKIEALRGKFEARDLINAKIVEDLRDLRNKFAVFRNLEMVQQLNEDSKKRFNQLRKIEASVMQGADKADSIFSDLDKTLSSIKDHEKMIADISKEMKKSLVDIDDLKNELKTKAGTKDVNALKDEMEKQSTKIFDKLLKDFAKEKDKVFKDIEKELKKQEVQLVHELLKDDLKKITRRLSALENGRPGQQQINWVDFNPVPKKVAKKKWKVMAFKK